MVMNSCWFYHYSAAKVIKHTFTAYWRRYVNINKPCLEQRFQKVTARADRCCCFIVMHLYDRLTLTYIHWSQFVTVSQRIEWDFVWVTLVCLFSSAVNTHVHYNLTFCSWCPTTDAMKSRFISVYITALVLFIYTTYRKTEFTTSRCFSLLSAQK